MKRNFLAFFLIFCFLLSAFGCARNDPPAPPETTDRTDETDSASEQEDLRLVSGGKSDYVIIRGEAAGSIEVDAAIALRKAIHDATGAELRIMNDEEPETDFEILVGKTNRSASIALADELKDGDYAIMPAGKSLLLCGGNPEKTKDAVDAFIAAYLNGQNGDLRFTGDMTRVEKALYAADTVKIGTQDLKDYVILRPAGAIYGEEEAAIFLQTVIRLRFGVSLRIVTDAQPRIETEIVIGTTNRSAGSAYQNALERNTDDRGLIVFDGNRVFLGGAGVGETRAAVRYFCSVYLSDPLVRDHSLEVIRENRAIPSRGTVYSTMSFNLLADNGDGKFETPQNRKEAVLNVILSAMPDTVGVQECTEYWYGVLTEALSPWYDPVGELNDPSGQRWRNAIFYRRDVFRLVKTETKWLSGTPSSKSKVEDSPQYRILTYAILEDRLTGERIAHYNTHMEFTEAARPMQFKVLMNLVNQCKYPLVLTGDFNTTSSSQYYSQIQSNGYRNAYDLTRDHDSIPTCGTSVIDFAFVSEQTVNVIAHEIFEGEYPNVKPSDHNAVLVWYSMIPEFGNESVSNK